MFYHRPFLFHLIFVSVKSGGQNVLLGVVLFGRREGRGGTGAFIDMFTTLVEEGRGDLGEGGG